jgi:hypothetical protein
LMRWLWRGHRGLEVLEVLLVAPILVMVILLVINGGYAMFANQMVQEAARDACREGVVAINPVQAADAAAHRYTDKLPGGPADVYIGVGADFMLCRVTYRVPSIAPVFPQIEVQGMAQMKMEGW